MLCTHTEPGWHVICQKQRGHLGPCSGVFSFKNPQGNGCPYSQKHTWKSPFDAHDLYFWALSDFQATLENAELSRETRQQAADFLNALNSAQTWAYKNGKTVWLELAKLILDGYRLRLAGKQWQARKGWQNGSRLEESVLALHSKREAELFKALESAAESRAQVLMV